MDLWSKVLRIRLDRLILWVIFVICLMPSHFKFQLKLFLFLVNLCWFLLIFPWDLIFQKSHFNLYFSHSIRVEVNYSGFGEHKLSAYAAFWNCSMGLVLMWGSNLFLIFLELLSSLIFSPPGVSETFYGLIGESKVIVVLMTLGACHKREI